MRVTIELYRTISTDESQHGNARLDAVKPELTSLLAYRLLPFTAGASHAVLVHAPLPHSSGHAATMC